MPHDNSQIPRRRADIVPLSQAERRGVIDRMSALEGRSRSFVAEIARQATDARGRLDDDVYGIVRVTLKALAENQGNPPPLVFAVTHHDTGEIRQVGFLPRGVRAIARGGNFETNDPRLRSARQLPGPHPGLIEGGQDA